MTSTYYESRNIGATLALKGESSLLTLKAGHQFIPGQGFVNQWMDMIENNASFLNIRYKSEYAWGKLDATAYWQNTWHIMNSGEDKLIINKRIPETMPDMPMETRGIDIGYSIKSEVPVAEKNVLRFGNEFHHFSLNDRWPAIYATTGSMGPNTFLNINDGRRDRYSVYGEWESKLSKQVATVLGIRNEQVQMETGNVQGYNDGDTVGPMPIYTNYKRDSDAFNAQDHTRNDSNWDMTALVKYKPGNTESYEVGYARKTRSPNLYERYAWSTMWMTSGMVNWFGDGNGYVGNQNLTPEVAHTLSISADWHDSDRKSWEVKLTPYYTYISDYIGVEIIGTQTWNWTGGSETRNILRFVNHDARLYGLDISGKMTLWENTCFGAGQLHGNLGYVHGDDLDTGGSLYHIMPLHGFFSLEQRLNGWSNAVEMQLVGRKSRRDLLRFEPETRAYALFNLRTAYQWKKLQMDIGVTNLFDTSYFLPLGGINYDNFLNSKVPPFRRAADFGPLSGQGRSLNVGLTQTF